MSEILNSCDSCPCVNVNCKRHGKCEECRDHHKDKEYPSYCVRDINDK